MSNYKNAALKTNMAGIQNFLKVTSRHVTYPGLH